MTDRPQPMAEHLAELRRRLLYALAAAVAGIAVATFFVHRLLKWILAEARAEAGIIPVQYSFTDAFLTELKLAVIGGLMLAFPLVLYQVVAFVLPALTARERQLLFTGLPLTVLLFVGGCGFGWFVVVPFTRRFFLGVATAAGVQPLITPGAYLSFVLGICLPLGILFELPLVVVILARIGLLSAVAMARMRKHALLVLLILAAVLSPPDVVSMGLFLIPLYGLYELSILVARVAGPRGEG
ncbi:MAG TPA: twin-arginine translocase subunit TatC [Symbiobacteriaceae bacterium]